MVIEARGPRATEDGTSGRTVRSVVVVPHTHWDREWYASFQTFRLRLVELIDQLLPLLDSDSGVDHFLLDGQMAMVDDYLAVRPEAEDTIRRLVTAGRLAVGPWYVLMDEFLVSGETLVRNLQLGVDRAASLGGAMAVGYLPDMFGHVAQMPQLLRSAGFRHAVVWRGVPSAVDRTGFWWSAPDGSTVRAEYLRVGYGNGAAMPADPDALVRRVAAHEAELGSFLAGPAAPVLLMAGSDHESPPPWLGRVTAAADAAGAGYRLSIGSLASYLEAAPTEGLPSWSGELRSGARANLLMGVASNRADVRGAAARVERALERQAEPLCALWLAPGRWPAALLGAAWLEVVRNSAHDSICACSVDEVGTTVLHRFDDAFAIADGLRHRGLAAAAAAMAAAGLVVVNPSFRARGGVVEVVVAGDGPVEGGQVLESVAAAAVEVSGRGGDLGTLLGGLTAQGRLVDRAITGIDLRSGDDGVEVAFRVGAGAGAKVSPGGGGGAAAAAPVPRDAAAPVPRDAAVRATMAEMWAQAGARRDRPLTVRVVQQPWQRLAVHVADVPGYGWAAWVPGPLEVAPVTVEGTGLDNGRISVRVDPCDGTFRLVSPATGPEGRSGLGRLVDDGDEGDTYNYSPPAGDVVVDRPRSVTVEVTERGPVRGRLRIERSYRWPARVDAGARTGEREVSVTTEVELRAGEEIVRLTTSLDNTCRDHRLRAWFPLPRQAEKSRAECAFGVVERGLTAEGGPHEVGLATFPSRRFVSAGGLTVVHDGLPEYELVDGGRALALTLLRATGMLSRDRIAYRPNPAGPAIVVEGPQMLGHQVFRYCLHAGRLDPYLLADQAWLPLEVVAAPGGGDRPARGQLLSVSGAEVSALHRFGAGLELRVFNPSDGPATVRLGGRSGVPVDLLGRPLGAAAQAFELGPWAIATIRLAEAGGDG
jgi:hypothetical protein